MSIVVLVLLLASILTAVGALGVMVAKREPFYGVVGLLTICLPSSLLAVVYVTIA
jgi:hypothetical protein